MEFLPGMVTHVCNPHTQGAETGVSLQVSGQPGIHSEYKAQPGLHSKTLFQKTKGRVADLAQWLKHLPWQA